MISVTTVKRMFVWLFLIGVVLGLEKSPYADLDNAFQSMELKLASGATGNCSTNSCKIAPGPNNTACSYYTNSKWLPPGYIKAAGCACQIDKLITRAANATTLPCVRGYLLNAHLKVPQELQRQMEQNRTRNCDAFSCSVAYTLWIQQVPNSSGKSVYTNDFCQ